MSELSPNGTLRVGVNMSNFLLVNKDAATGELRGIVPDLAQELGRRLEATVQLVPFAGAGETADGAKSGAWDVAFLGAEPQRARGILADEQEVAQVDADAQGPAGRKFVAHGQILEMASMRRSRSFRLQPRRSAAPRSVTMMPASLRGVETGPESSRTMRAAGTSSSETPPGELPAARMKSSAPPTAPR